MVVGIVCVSARWRLTLADDFRTWATTYFHGFGVFEFIHALENPDILQECAIRVCNAPIDKIVPITNRRKSMEFPSRWYCHLEQQFPPFPLLYKQHIEAV